MTIEIWEKQVSVILDGFDKVRIINLVDRADRRREISKQLERLAMPFNAKTSFFAAHRPNSPGNFPSLGARGCFESHLAILREALADGINRLLIIEDDFDFAPDFESRGPVVMAALAAMPWDLFYAAPILVAADESRMQGDGSGLVELAADVPIMTTSCVGFGRTALIAVEPFLTAMMSRPAGSPDFGPMHVDGAYSVFRAQHPWLRTVVCQPTLGAQRASRSDIAPSRFILDRFELTRPLANRLRRFFGARGR